MQSPQGTGKELPNKNSEWALSTKRFHKKSYVGIQK
jgi:hypothetical protein